MGFGDKLKGLRDQAQQAVSENKDKIEGAVQTAGQLANTKTKGKYASTIAKVGEKVTTGVDKFATEGEEPAGEEAPMHVDSASTPTADSTEPTPVEAKPSTPAPSSAPPEFE